MFKRVDYWEYSPKPSELIEVWEASGRKYPLWKIYVMLKWNETPMGYHINRTLKNDFTLRFFKKIRNVLGDDPRIINWLNGQEEVQEYLENRTEGRKIKGGSVSAWEGSGGCASGAMPLPVFMTLAPVYREQRDMKEAVEELEKKDKILLVTVYGVTIGTLLPIIKILYKKGPLDKREIIKNFQEFHLSVKRRNIYACLTTRSDKESDALIFRGGLPGEEPIYSLFEGQEGPI